MVALSVTTTFKKNPPFTWFFASAVAQRNARRRRTTYDLYFIYAVSFLKDAVADSEKGQAQAQEGEDGHPQILQGRFGW
jgi:hypothetical protein